MRQAGPVVLNILAAALPIITLPLITRLYPPEVYGAYTAFLAVATLVCFLGTLRLDLGILSARNMRESLVLAVVLVACIGLAAVLWPLLTAILPDLARFRPSVFGLANGQAVVLVILMGMLIAAQAMLMQRGQTLILAGLNLTFQLLFLCLALVGSQTVAWFANAWFANGMIDARFGALLIAAPAFGIIVAKALRAKYARGSGLRESIETVKGQRRIVTFTYPYTIIGMLSADLILLFLLARNDLALAGAYGLVRSLMLAPGSIFGSVVSPLFYRFMLRESAERRAEVAASLARGIGPVGFFIYGLAAGAAATLLLVFFGPNWTLAAGVLPIMAFPMAWTLLTGWPERIFEAKGRMGLGLGLHILWATLSATFLFLGPAIAPDMALMPVIAFVSAFLLFQLAYATAAFRLCGLGWQWIIAGALAVSGCFALGYVLALLTAKVLSGLPLVVAIATMAALAGALGLRPVLAALAQMNASASERT